MGVAVDEATMKADLTARLAVLERQLHADRQEIFRAGTALAQTEGRIAEVKAILSGFDAAT
jgi:ABC-type phosphate transport system auxiliary subunit